MDRSVAVLLSSLQPKSHSSRLWWGWLLLVLVFGSLWASQVPGAFQRLANPPAAVLPVLQAAYITAWGHALYHLTLDLFFALGALGLAAALLWRHRQDRLAVLASFTLTTWGLTNGVMTESLLSDRWWTWLACGLGWGIWLFFLAYNLWLHRQAVPLSLRQRVRWHLYGAVTSLVGIVLVVATVGSALTLPPEAVDRHMTGHLLVLLAGSIFLATLAAAWLLPTLPDPDTLINRTLFYGALTGSIVFANIALILTPVLYFIEILSPVYLLIVATLWALLGLPLQQTLQRIVNRLLYGQRDEPVTVINQLGQRLELGAPETVLLTIAETVAHTLKVPAVTIRSQTAETPLASFGQSDLTPLVFAINYQGEQVGELVVSPRARDEPLHEHDYELLRLLARQAGATVHAVHLTQALRRSRQQILTGREEERRRIRRDLHDGLGPSLANFAMRLEQARESLPPAAEVSDALLAKLTADAQSTITDIRRLVYELRPPDLDEFGLVSALREYLHRIQPKGIIITLDAPDIPDELSELPSAVEVAAYRIVQEAVNNALKHAQASAISVTLALLPDAAGPGGLPSSLRVEICDNGVGLPADHPVGIGLHSMRERAEELGGSLGIASLAQGGVKVMAQLPVQ